MGHSNMQFIKKIFDLSFLLIFIIIFWIVLEYEDPIGPFGARGMGEMPFLVLTPAVVSAVHQALGIWINEFPLTPERVLHALGRLGEDQLS